MTTSLYGEVSHTYLDNILLGMYFSVLLCYVHVFLLKKIRLVFNHMGLQVDHEPSCYYPHRHLLIPAILQSWRSYQTKILSLLGEEEVILAGDGKYDSRHSTKFCTYTIFCRTAGLILYVVLIQLYFLQIYVLYPYNDAIIEKTLTILFALCYNN